MLSLILLLFCMYLGRIGKNIPQLGMLSPIYPSLLSVPGVSRQNRIFSVCFIKYISYIHSTICKFLPWVLLCHQHISGETVLLQAGICRFRAATLCCEYSKDIFIL